MVEPNNEQTKVAARTSSRDAILGRVRAATAEFRPEPIQRTYRGASSRSVADDDTIDQFIDRLLDYKAAAAVCVGADVMAQVKQFLHQDDARNVVVPAGFPTEWRGGPPSGGRWLADDPPLSDAALDRADGVLTTCAVAVAETGTIVLDGGDGQGRRALTLLPDLHIIVVAASQLVGRVPDALPQLNPQRPLTWISGPSATSDIELNRVEGVHGPRKLKVVICVTEGRT